MVLDVTFKSENYRASNMNFESLEIIFSDMSLMKHEMQFKHLP